MGLPPLDERNYPGLVLTCIPVEERDDGRVYFNEKDENSGKGTFLKDIKQSNKSNKAGQCEFSALKVEIEEAKANISYGTPLFCVHGFNVEPSESLFSNPGCYKSAYDNFAKNKKYYPVPVIWASEGNTLRYNFDQENNSMNAGKELFNFVNSIDNSTFPRKSLLMHSMGNHSVFNAACGEETAPDVQFENIFLVAADIPHDVFHDKPNNNYRWSDNGKYFGRKKEKAENMLQMMDRTKGENIIKGKICVVHHRGDRALFFSEKKNWETRIGDVGHAMQRRWWGGWSYTPSLGDPKFKDVIENKDFSKKRTTDWLTKHSYHFDDLAIEYYESKSDQIRQD